MLDGVQAFTRAASRSLRKLDGVRRVLSVRLVIACGVTVCDRVRILRKPSTVPAVFLDGVRPGRLAIANACGRAARVIMTACGVRPFRPAWQAGTHGE